MLKPTFQLSRAGFIAAGLFLSLFVLIFAWVFLVASKNPADSGESAIILLPFTMPWTLLAPTNWLGPLFATGTILVNTLLVYLIFGGLRLKR